MVFHFRSSFSANPILPILLTGLVLRPPTACNGLFVNTVPFHPSLQSLCTGSNVDVTIPSGRTYIIDDGTVDCGLVTIIGTLQCSPGAVAVVKAAGIQLLDRNALLECGTRTARFDGDVAFEITRDRGFGTGTGERSIVVAKGTLSLWGKGDKNGRTRLGMDAPANAGAIDVASSGVVAAWKASDEIMVTTTSTYPDQTERHNLSDAACSANGGTTCGLITRLTYPHYGEGMQRYPGAGANKDLIVDQRAIVANLERNIVLRVAENDVLWQAQEKGGHLMVLAGGAIYLDSVKFERMGQKGILGRYPIHFHHVGNVEGQHVINSIIVDSASRCIALHNTHKALIDNNICHNVLGHAIFLEEGNEVENIITNNLISDVIEPAQGDNLLLTDRDVQISRWRGPAGVWVSNPKNEIQGNTVVNAGTAYWHAYIHNLYCYNDPNNKDGTDNCVYCKYCDYIPRGQPSAANVRPNFEQTLVYKDNTAISCRVGHTWDGAPDGGLNPNGSGNNPFDRETVVTGYSPQPSSTQIFDGMHAYKSQKTGIYFRGNPVARITNAVVAEAPIGWFGTGDQDFFDSLFIGVGAAYRGFDPGDTDWFYHMDPNPNIKGADQAGLNKLFMGWGLYDGSNHFKHVTFDYPTKPMYLRLKEITPVPIEIFGRAHFANHILEEIRFYPNEPYRKISLDSIFFSVNWKDVAYSESLHDIDGSLFGTSGYIRLEHDFNFATGCDRKANLADPDPSTPPSAVYLCDLPTSSIKFQMNYNDPNDDYQEFTVAKQDNGATAGAPVGELFSKFQVYNDTFYFIDNLNFKGQSSPNLVWIETQQIDDWTPPLIIDGSSATNLAPGCLQASDYKLENFFGGSGGIFQATTVQEIRDFNDNSFRGAYLQLGGTANLLAIKLKGYNPTGNPDPHPNQPQADGKFNLKCP